MNALVWLLAAVAVFLLGRSVIDLYDNNLYGPGRLGPLRPLPGLYGGHLLLSPG